MMYQVLDDGRRPCYRGPELGLMPLLMPVRGDLRSRMRGWSPRLARARLLVIGGLLRA